MIYYLHFNQRRETWALQTIKQINNVQKYGGKRNAREYRCFRIDAPDYCEAKCVASVVDALMRRNIIPEVKNVRTITHVIEIQPME